MSKKKLCCPVCGSGIFPKSKQRLHWLRCTRCDFSANKKDFEDEKSLQEKADVYVLSLYGTIDNAAITVRKALLSLFNLDPRVVSGITDGFKESLGIIEKSSEKILEKLELLRKIFSARAEASLRR